MSRDKELAFRYDLFITPDWRNRFDTLVNESVRMPKQGRVLDVNSGTGAHTIEMAEKMKDKGEIIGVDPSAERVELARAKALVRKTDSVEFHQSIAAPLPFDDDQFDLVIGDASMLEAREIEDVLEEMIRVAQPEARVVLKMTTRGSFDEFFSIYWEALLSAGLDDAVWKQLEAMINERMTVTAAEQMARRAGLRNVESFISKEEFDYKTGSDFVDSPLIEDVFLDDWLQIVPEGKRAEVRERIVEIIERERRDAPFDVSIKATVISGVK